MSKFILSVNCCFIDSVARFLNRNVLILDLKQFLISFSFEKLLTGSNTNSNCEETPQHYYYIWNRLPKVILLNKLQNVKAPSFYTVYCTSATSHNCDATITFFNCTTVNNRRRKNYQYLFSGYQLHSTSCTTNWPTWNLNAKRWSKDFLNDASTYWARNHFP